MTNMLLRDIIIFEVLEPAPKLENVDLREGLFRSKADFTFSRANFATQN